MSAPARGAHPFFHDPRHPEPSLARTHSPAALAEQLRGALAGTGADLTGPLAAQPLVLPRRSYDELFGVGRVLLGLVRRAVLSLGPTWPERLVALDADPADHPLLSGLDNTETDYCAMMARADIVVGEAGPQLLGFDAGDTFGGPHETHAFTRVWRRTHTEDGRPPFTGHDPLAARVGAFEDVCTRRGLPRALAVIAGPHCPGPRAGSGLHERDLEHFRARGFEAARFGPGELPAALGHPGKLRYPLGLRDFAPGDWSGSGVSVEPVRDAQRAGLLLLPPQSSALLDNKRALALVSEGLPWMTRGERGLVDRWLPWTRITVAGRTAWHGTEQELPGLLLGDRERFVLKSAVRAGGRQVLVGRECGARAWAAAVERAFLEGDSVVQEYVEPAGAPVELTDGETTWMSRLTPVLSPMLFGGRPGGCWARSRLAAGGTVQNAVLTRVRDGGR
ncbi:hypothetical protein [Streptomyces iconiensis]|uniref:Circularly permuted type 2 ATP-grasp protein n=1 Tax=Streptomyces iconiensis TaxID=1384038 RepID=A0ABT6ZY08_9ACTN|nr:hypothetical protein [Streptomyces iconiensis]MDJ1133954.1 hypothetical protein [Streptomyces iconiensis]